jgi:hypothetical protein
MAARYGGFHGLVLLVGLSEALAWCSQHHRGPSRGPGHTSYDVVLACQDRARLAKRLPTLIERTTPAGAVWIAWPKMSSGVPTDLTEDGIREIALPLGLVDVKVCAVDDTWSGLKLVRRLTNR